MLVRIPILTRQYQSLCTLYLKTQLIREVTNLCELIILKYGGSYLLHFDFLTNFILSYFCYGLFEKLSFKNLKSYLYIYILYCCIISCMYIERYLLTELLNSSSHYLSFSGLQLVSKSLLLDLQNLLFCNQYFFSLCIISALQL